MSQEFYDAATFGKLERVRKLLAANSALVGSKDEWGFTALHGVAGEEEFQMAEFLLDNGADPNAKNDDGIAPLHLAVYPEMVEILVRRGADINIRSNDGSTPLIVQAAEAEGYETMAALLELGADVKAKNGQGESALDIARAREEEEKVELLMEYGAG